MCHPQREICNCLFVRNSLTFRQSGDFRTYIWGFNTVFLTLQGPEPGALASGVVGTTPVLIAGSRNGIIYVFNMRGVSASFESAHREGSTNDIWNNLYTNNAAGDQIISDMGYVDEIFNTFFFLQKLCTAILCPPTFLHHSLLDIPIINTCTSVRAVYSLTYYYDF